MYVIKRGGSWSGNERNHLFINKKGSQFEELSLLSGLDDPSDGRCCVTWDYDHDGWQDLVVINSNEPQFRFFRNQIGEIQSDIQLNMFALRFVGSNHSAQPSPNKSNRNGYGARVSVSLGQQVLTREHNCGEGLAAQNSATMILGIGSQSQADQVKVRWPSGKIQTTSNIPAKTLVTVYEDPTQSPTGEAFVVGEYTPARPRKMSPTDDVDDAVRLTLRTTDSQIGPQLRLYMTMATWCAACAKKVPAVKQLRSQFEEDELAMFGVPVDEDDKPQLLQDWAARMQPAYELLTHLSQDEIQPVRDVVLQELKTEALPAAIITDGEGRVLHVQGGLPSVSKIRELLKSVGQ